MINILNTAAYVTSSIIFAGLLFLSISFIIKNVKNVRQIVQLNVENAALAKRIEELKNEVASQKLTSTDGFIGFISQSRDMAFTYIEDVQKDIAELKDYFDKNGLNLNVGQAEEFSQRIEKIFDYLPENSKND